jgi:hypothetical protein
LAKSRRSSPDSPLWFTKGFVWSFLSGTTASPLNRKGEAVVAVLSIDRTVS